MAYLALLCLSIQYPPLYWDHRATELLTACALNPIQANVTHLQQAIHAGISSKHRVGPVFRPIAAADSIIECIITLLSSPTIDLNLHPVTALDEPIKREWQHEESGLAVIKQSKCIICLLQVRTVLNWFPLSSSLWKLVFTCWLCWAEREREKWGCDDIMGWDVIMVVMTERFSAEERSLNRAALTFTECVIVAWRLWVQIPGCQLTLK